MYSNAGISDQERDSFRGQFLRDVEDVLGTELLARAYETLSASAGDARLEIHRHPEYR